MGMPFHLERTASSISPCGLKSPLSGTGEAAHVVIRVDDNEKASEALTSKGYKLIGDADIK